MVHSILHIFCGLFLKADSCLFDCKPNRFQFSLEDVIS